MLPAAKSSLLYTQVGVCGRSSPGRVSVETKVEEASLRRPIGSVYLQVDMRIDQQLPKPREGARCMSLHVQYTTGWLVAHALHRKRT